MEAEPNLLKGDKIKIFLIGKPHPDVNPLVLPLCLGKSPLTQFPICFLTYSDEWEGKTDSVSDDKENRSDLIRTKIWVFHSCADTH